MTTSWHENCSNSCMRAGIYAVLGCFRPRGRRAVWVPLYFVGVLGFGLGMLPDAAFGRLVDPTRPQIGVAVYESGYGGNGPVLQSTYVSPGIKRAVINGKSYTVGDKVRGAVITDIRSYEVVMKQAGREKRLRLLPMLPKTQKSVKTNIKRSGGSETEK